jgi:putative selenate reductase molybdopterin-binding subunit
VTVQKLVMAVDCGTAINPRTAEGQIEGGLVQALGYAVSEEMVYDEPDAAWPPASATTASSRPMKCRRCRRSWCRPTSRAAPTAPRPWPKFPMDGVAPAIANAVQHAVGVRIRDLPLTPEKVWREINEV